MSSRNAPPTPQSASAACPTACATPPAQRDAQGRRGDAHAHRCRLAGGARRRAGPCALLEHMAFRGSAKVPDGEVVHTLQRHGLSFGPDTNAYTAHDQTVYMFNFPKANATALDTGFLLFSEIGQHLTLDPKGRRHRLLHGRRADAAGGRFPLGLRNAETCGRSRIPAFGRQCLDTGPSTAHSWELRRQSTRPVTHRGCRQATSRTLQPNRGARERTLQSMGASPSCEAAGTCGRKRNRVETFPTQSER
jgi:hypothetical protein